MKAALFTAEATVTLHAHMKAPRRQLHGGRYRPTIVFGSPTQLTPHRVAGRLTELLYGVAFLHGPELLRPGESADVTLGLLFLPDPALAKQIHAGSEFTLREAGTIVGFGIFRSNAAQPGVAPDPHASASLRRGVG